LPTGLSLATLLPIANQTLTNAWGVAPRTNSSAQFSFGVHRRRYPAVLHCATFLQTLLRGNGASAKQMPGDTVLEQTVPRYATLGSL